MIAVVGCGAWGKNLVRNFRALGVLSAVVDSAPEARHRAERLAPETAVFDDVARVFDDDRISALAIATPAETHAELCHAALASVKDVFCEKPLALRYEDAAEVARHADAAARILMVGHILEYHPGIVAVRGVVDRGELGDVRAVHATRLLRSASDGDANIIWSLAPHDVAVTLRLFGALPDRVVARGGAWIRRGVPGVASIRLEFARASADLLVSCVHHYKEQRLAVVGTDATACFDDVRDELFVHDGAARKIAFADAEPLEVECRAFLTALETRHPPLADGRSALDVLRVVAAAEESLLADGRAVTP